MIWMQNMWFISKLICELKLKIFPDFLDRNCEALKRNMTLNNNFSHPRFSPFCNSARAKIKAENAKKNKQKGIILKFYEAHSVFVYDTYWIIYTSPASHVLIRDN